ncbi:MAG: hypothetical protein EZS28_011638 [Streblomastix strix]|uniref:Peptidase M28 domain-containing protein n=1 Tax=Streblomastix strix TaxID=222440 RepID=A0A5J4WE67_9EUKA|nr:MAG: hypothetical protein EZS28_011638 [Streblomastix strix]
MESRRAKGKTFLQNYILTKTFCFWAIFGIIVFSVANTIILFVVHDARPSSGNTYDSMLQLSESSLRSLYLNPLAEPVKDFFSATFSEGWQSNTNFIIETLANIINTKPERLLMEISVGNEKGFRLSKSTFTAYSSAPYIAVWMQGQSTLETQNEALLIYSSYDSSISGPAVLGGKVGSAVMLEVIRLIASYNGPSFILRSPIIFFFDSRSFAPGKPSLHSFLTQHEWSKKFGDLI